MTHSCGAVVDSGAFIDGGTVFDGGKRVMEKLKSCLLVIYSKSFSFSEDLRILKFWGFKIFN